MKTNQQNSRWLRTVTFFLVLSLSFSTLNVSLSTQHAYAVPVVNVTTFAGTNSVGYMDGQAASAQFNYPHDIAFDTMGTMYVADTSNNRIRAISPSGVVSTFAGSGVEGGADGTGTSAQFNSPHSIAINPTNGMMYVTEASLTNNTPRVRAITPSGVVTTLAGSGLTGFANGTGTAAQFFFPTGIAVNATTGIIYVADSYAHSIRAITPSGVVTTLAGSASIAAIIAALNGGYADGTGTNAQFSYPQGMDVDGSGTIYVTEFGGHRIRTITPTGIVSTLAGTGVAGYTDGPGAAAQFNHPSGVVVDSVGTVYIADSSNNRIRAISPAGIVSTLAGTGAAGFVDGAGDIAQLNTPTGLVFNSAGLLYITDTYNQLIRRMTIIDPVITPSASVIPGAPNTGVKSEPYKQPLLGATGIFLAILFTLFFAYRVSKQLRKQK